MGAPKVRACQKSLPTCRQAPIGLNRNIEFIMFSSYSRYKWGQARRILLFFLIQKVNRNINPISGDKPFPSVLHVVFPRSSNSSRLHRDSNSAASFAVAIKLHLNAKENFCRPVLNNYFVLIIWNLFIKAIKDKHLREV